MSAALTQEAVAQNILFSPFNRHEQLTALCAGHHQHTTICSGAMLSILCTIN